MTQKHAIIFDLDGTLVDSAPDLQAAINHALIALGRTTLDLQTVISFIGNGVERLVTRSLEATGTTNPELAQETLSRFLAYYDTNSVVFTRPYAGLLPLLDVLTERGIPLGICTNKPTKPARDICDALGLSNYFKVIAGAEAGQPKKPDPAPLLACCQALGTETARTIYLGDSAVDHQTARNARIDFGFFTGGYLNTPLPTPDPRISFDAWSDPHLLRFCCDGPAQTSA